MQMLLAQLGPSSSPWNFRSSSRRVLGRGRQTRRRATLVRCSPGSADQPQDSPKSSGDVPQRAPHPELEGSDSVGSASASGIPDTLPYLGDQSDWREFRARLVSQARGGASGGSGPSSASSGGSGEWAHHISGPERGCLLLAHPLLFQQSQTYFHRAAILLLDHGEKGSYGVILNRPSKYLLGDVPLSRPQSQFAECRLYVGGDVGAGEVQVLHPHGDLAGAIEVVKGVYLGGMDAARDAVDAGRVSATDFRWFSAYAGWAPGQLQMECKRGVWFTVAASPGLLLREVEVGEGPAYWHRVMALLGGDYEELSQAVRKHDDLADFS